jgi:hypothetical protein
MAAQSTGPAPQTTHGEVAGPAGSARVTGEDWGSGVVAVRGDDGSPKVTPQVIAYAPRTVTALEPLPRLG